MVLPVDELNKNPDSNLPRAIQNLLSAQCRMTAELQAVRAENERLRAALTGRSDGSGCESNSTTDDRRNEQRAISSDDTLANSCSCLVQDSFGRCGHCCGTQQPTADPAPGHGSRSESPAWQPTDADGSSTTEELLFAGMRRLLVIDEFAVSVELYMHESIIRKLPYFEVRTDRWGAGDAEEFHLPNCCPHLCFNAVLCRLYSLNAHWSPADWTRILGTDLSVAYGALLLAKMLLAADLVHELLALVRQLASDTASAAWLQREVEGLDIPELKGFSAASDVAALDAATLKQAALSAMTGSAEGRRLFKSALAKREAEGLANGDAEALVSALREHDSYVTPSCTHSICGARSRRAAVTSMLGPHRIWACDFFRPFRIPLESFSWLWQLIRERVQAEPRLFSTTLAAFQDLQWLEFDVNANRLGHESIAGSRRLRHLPETASKQSIRRAYASYLQLGLDLFHRGHLSEHEFLEAFSCGTFSSSQAPEVLRGRRRNILHFQPTAQRPCTNYVDNIDLLELVFSSVNESLGGAALGLVADFRDWQWAFSATAVCSLSDAQQTHCVQGCTLKWLTREVCTALRGEARALACTRLSAHIGSITSAQQAFLRARFADAIM